MAQDPVCGKWIGEENSPRSEFEGQYYYFCSEDCKLEFDDDPDRYLGWGGAARFGSA